MTYEGAYLLCDVICLSLTGSKYAQENRNLLEYVVEKSIVGNASLKVSWEVPLPLSDK